MCWVTWIDDGATIKRVPLMNMLVLCGEEAKVVVSVCNCTNHMVEGNKKDAE